MSKNVHKNFAKKLKMFKNVHCYFKKYGILFDREVEEWDNLLGGKLSSENLLKEMLSLQSGGDDGYYGYGIWLEKTKEGTLEPWFQGCDPGVSFLSSYNRNNNTNITIISNTGNNVWEIKKNFFILSETIDINKKIG